MNGFVIKYNDIYNLLWEYKSKLENLMERIDVCQESINRFIGDSGFQGKAATAIKSYMNDVHLTMLSSFRVTIQSLLDNIVLYKAGYYGIDDSTNFVIPEETIKEFRTKLNTNYMEMQEQEDGVYRAVSGISDISSVGQPDTNQVPKIHQQLDQELLNLITDIETQESSTVTALEQSTELLITSLNNCIGKIGTNWTDINSYEGNSFYTDVDAYVLANLSQMFYQQHEANQEVYDEIWEVEQSLKDAAEERETMGIWKTIGGAALVITGVFCIAASGGAATPVVVAGWTSGGVTVAFGVCDSIEGAQDIYYGSMGDIDSTAFNCLKDVVFQGNEDAYYMVENIFACSASACIPISRASQVGQLTFRSGSVIAAKEVMSTVIGDKTSELTMDLTGNRTLSMLAGMVSSNASAHGLNGLDARFNWSGYTYQSLLGKMSPEDAKAYEHFMKNGSEAGLTEIELNALQKVDGQIALNKIDIDEWLKFKKSESGSNSTVVSKLTSADVKAAIEKNGMSVEDFSKLLDPNRMLTPDELKFVDRVRADIGLPEVGTVMNKTIPQSDIYNYLYNENYSGVRGFVSVDEHSNTLKTLADVFEGNRLDYNNTAFKTGSGVDGISKSVGNADTVYGKITYVLDDADGIKVPEDFPIEANAPYTGRGFTGSKNIVLPELVQDTRPFVDGDILGIYDAKTGALTQQFVYDSDLGWLLR